MSCSCLLGLLQLPLLPAHQLLPLGLWGDQPCQPLPSSFLRMPLGFSLAWELTLANIPTPLSWACRREMGVVLASPSTGPHSPIRRLTKDRVPIPPLGVQPGIHTGGEALPNCHTNSGLLLAGGASHQTRTGRGPQAQVLVLACPGGPALAIIIMSASSPGVQILCLILSSTLCASLDVVFTMTL